MKNKFLFLGSLILVVALGFVFVGCNDVKTFEFAKLSSPKNVTYDEATSTFKWDAVKGADEYYLAVLQDGKKNYYFDTTQALGEPVTNDTDKYLQMVPLSAIASGIGSYIDADDITLKIGVIAGNSVREDINPSNPTYVSQKFAYDGTDVTVK